MIPRKLLLAAAVMFAATACHAQKSPVSAANFHGRWKVTDTVGYADVGGGTPLGKQLMGKVLTVSATEMTLDLDNWGCTAHTGFRTREIESAPFLDEQAGARPEAARLPARVTILESDNCIPVFWLDENHVEFDYLGVFVRAARLR